MMVDIDTVNQQQKHQQPREPALQQPPQPKQQLPIEVLKEQRDGENRTLSFISQSRANTTFSNNSTDMAPYLTIVLLAMNRFDALDRLVESLQRSNYLGDRVDLIIRFDRPKFIKKQQQTTSHTNEQDDFETRWTLFKSQISSSWIFGKVQVTREATHVGLRKAWLNAWKPTTDDERAIIFEDDIVVSQHWYQWWKKADQVYHDRKDLAGVSLQRQQLIPLKLPKGPRVGLSTKLPPKQPNNLELQQPLPFLYPLVGSIGFAPKASVWSKFLEFAECALANNNNRNNKISIATPELVTSDWYYSPAMDQSTMWTQVFIYFCKYYSYRTLYFFPRRRRTLAAHVRSKDATHPGGKLGPDFQLAEYSDIFWTDENKNNVSLLYPSNIISLDWGARPISNDDGTSISKQFAILSASIGYSYSQLQRFVTMARKHFDGDIWLLLSKHDADSEPVQTLLKQYDIHSVTTTNASPVRKAKRLSKEWFEINRQRWQFYNEACNYHNTEQQSTPLTSAYQLCLAVDFRDVGFQDNPFVNLTSTFTTTTTNNQENNRDIFHFFAHNIPMNDWHFDGLKTCHPLGAQYRKQLEQQLIVNAGGVIASPKAFTKLAQLLREEGPKCDDQIALNLFIYGGFLNKNNSSDSNNVPPSITIHRQGYGNVNNIGWGGVFTVTEANNNRPKLILNRNCFVSPIVHQYDTIKSVASFFQ
ncbi:hypothetical protein ACA910_021008 [Epithemia clementina (nom. ined.)]